jgi:hypothetical protein
LIFDKAEFRLNFARNRYKGKWKIGKNNFFMVFCAFPLKFMPTHKYCRNKKHYFCFVFSTYGTYLTHFLSKKTNYATLGVDNFFNS